MSRDSDQEEVIKTGTGAEHLTRPELQAFQLYSPPRHSLTSNHDDLLVIEVSDLRGTGDGGGKPDSAMEVELAHNGKQPEDPTGGGGKDEKPTPAVGLGELFRFADGLDLILMAIGTVGAVVHGCSLPVFLRFFADLVNSFGSNSSDLDTMVREVIKISCWMWTGERQTTKMRIRYLESALNQDVRYFDTEVCDLDLPAWFTNRFDDAVHDLVRVEVGKP